MAKSSYNILKADFLFKEDKELEPLYTILLEETVNSVMCASVI